MGVGDDLCECGCAVGAECFEVGELWLDDWDEWGNDINYTFAELQVDICKFVWCAPRWYFGSMYRPER